MYLLVNCSKFESRNPFVSLLVCPTFSIPPFAVDLCGTFAGLAVSGKFVVVKLRISIPMDLCNTFSWDSSQNYGRTSSPNKIGVSPNLQLLCSENTLIRLIHLPFFFVVWIILMHFCTFGEKRIDFRPIQMRKWTTNRKLKSGIMESILCSFRHFFSLIALVFFLLCILYE